MRTTFRRIPTTRAAVLALLLALPLAGHSAAQESDLAERHISALEREHPELYALLLSLEEAHGLLYAGLAAEGEAVRASGDSIPSFDFEFDMFDRLLQVVEGAQASAAIDAEAAAGYAVLGPRAVEVIRRTNAFYLELLGIYADPDIQEKDQAVEEAVDRYRSRPEVALPDVPKDMDILYDHTYTWALKTGYPDLIGFTWAGHWLQLAAIEPLMDSRTEAALLAGIDTVMTRHARKLSYGEEPDAFPTELPLSPSITPGLIARHPRAGAILDNLNMMHNILADVLVAPTVPDLRAALDIVVDGFVDPNVGVVPRNEWIVMALRHSIFNQGGPALGVMVRTERNAGGHAQHLQSGGGGGRAVFPGM